VSICLLFKKHVDKSCKLRGEDIQIIKDGKILPCTKISEFSNCFAVIKMMHKSNSAEVLNLVVKF